MHNAKQWICSFIFGGMAVGSVVAADPNAERWDKRIGPARDRKTSTWWSTTWKQGDYLEMKTTFAIEGDVRIGGDSAKEVKWYQFPSKMIGVNQGAGIYGAIETQTTVLQDGSSSPKDGYTQLVRKYHTSLSTRGLQTVGLSGESVDSIRRAYNKTYECWTNPRFRKLRADTSAAFRRIGAQLLTKAALAGNVVKPGFGVAVSVGVSSAIDKLDDWTGWRKDLAEGISDKLYAQYCENIEKLAKSEFEDGGIEFKDLETQPWYKRILKIDRSEPLNNLAGVIDDLFKFKIYYIAGKPDEPLFAVNMANDDAAEILENLPQKGKDGYSTLPRKMMEVTTRSDDKAAALIGRESINVNAILFDYDERRVGETWVSDAKLLNSYLHPDLKGSFSGSISFKYLADEKFSLSKFTSDVEAKVYDVRHIVMEPGSEDSCFAYEEASGFRFEYGPETRKDMDAKIHVYVDKESGYILSIEVEMTGELTADGSRLLPKMALTLGFERGDGKLSLRMNAQCHPSFVYRPEDFVK